MPSPEKCRLPPPGPLCGTVICTRPAAGSVRAEQSGAANWQRARGAWLEINLLATNSARTESGSPDGEAAHPQPARERERAALSRARDISGPVIMQATDVIIAGYVALSIISPGYVHAQTRHIVLALSLSLSAGYGARAMKMRVHRRRRRVRARSLLFGPRTLQSKPCNI